MTDEILAPILAVGILAALALWVPTLHLCDGCLHRLLRREPVARTSEDAVDQLRDVA